MSEERWTLEQVGDEVFNIIKNEKRLDDSFMPSTPLESVGIDSLALVRILVAIDQVTGVWLEGDALSADNLKNSRTVAQRVYAELTSNNTTLA